MKRTRVQTHTRDKQKERPEPPLAAQENAALQTRENPDDQETEYELITREEYIKEREHLYKYEATNYESYEKQILTLAAAFLAFSVSFLALLRNKPTAQLSWHSVLVSSWICFAMSVISIVVSFPLHAKGIRSDLERVEQLYDGKKVSDTMNSWYKAGYFFYSLGGLSFVAGLILLLIFCAHNVYVF